MQHSLHCLYLLQQTLVNAKIHRGCKDEEKLVPDGGFLFMGGSGIHGSLDQFCAGGWHCPSVIWELQGLDLHRKELKNKSE